MSRRKRYRKIRNEALKNNLAEFEQRRRDKAREIEAEETKEQLGRARLMYDEFKKAMTEPGMAKTREDVVMALEALKDAIKKVVKNKFARNTMLTEINFAMTKFLLVYGPKSKPQTNRRALPPPSDPVDPARN